MIKRLLRTPAPFPDESLSGYIVRLSEINYYDNPRWLLEKSIFARTGGVFNIDLLARSPSDLNMMSSMVGIGVDVLWNMSSPPGDMPGSVRFGKGQISGYFIQKTTTKVCPECLKEAIYWRKSWILNIYNACPKHRCLLVDKCPKCGEKISLFSRSVATCKCGHDFKECSTLAENINTSFVEEIDFKSGYSQMHFLQPPLADVSLYYFVKLIYLTAVYITGSSVIDTSGKYINRIIENVEINQVLSEALNPYSNWPKNFIEFLSKNRISNINFDGGSGVKKEYGAFYSTITQNFINTPLDFVRKAFLEYLDTQWDGGYSRKIRLLSKSSIVKKFVTKTEAIEYLHVKESCIDRCLNDGSIKGKSIHSGKKRFFLIDVESLKEYKRQLEDSYSLSQSALLLGIGHESVADLARLKLITALQSTQDGYSKWSLCKESINELLNKIKNRAANNDNDTKECTLHETLRIISGAGLKITDLIQAIFSDKISVFISYGIGLQHFTYCHDDLINLAYSKGKVSKKEFMTVLDVSNLLNIKQEVIAYWIDKDIIHGIVDFAGARKRRLVSSKDLFEFNSTYVSAVDLANKFGSSSKSIVNLLEKKLVKPISGPPVDGCRQYLFLRSDLSSGKFDNLIPDEELSLVSEEL